MLTFSLFQIEGEQSWPSRAATLAEDTVTSGTGTVPDKSTFQRSAWKRVQVSSPNTRDASRFLGNASGQPDQKKRELSKQTVLQIQHSHMCRHTRNNCKVTAVFSPIHLSVLALERTNTGCSLPLTPSPPISKTDKQQSAAAPATSPNTPIVASDEKLQRKYKAP